MKESVVANFATTAAEELKQPRKRLPKEKVGAITDALKYFEVI